MNVPVQCWKILVDCLPLLIHHADNDDDAEYAKQQSRTGLGKESHLSAILLLESSSEQQQKQTGITVNILPGDGLALFLQCLRFWSGGVGGVLC